MTLAGYYYAPQHAPLNAQPDDASYLCGVIFKSVLDFDSCGLHSQLSPVGQRIFEKIAENAADSSVPVFSVAVGWGRG